MCLQHVDVHSERAYLSSANAAEDAAKHGDYLNFLCRSRVLTMPPKRVLIERAAGFVSSFFSLWSVYLHLYLASCLGQKSNGYSILFF